MGEQADQAGTEGEHHVQTPEAARALVAQWQARMEEIRAATQVEVLEKWVTPWKNDETVKVKVDARLASNKEFREIMVKARETRATWGLDASS